MTTSRAHSRALWAHSPAPLHVLVGILCLLCAAPAPADWLVGSDGERVETRGPWRVKRSLVVFTSADGTLSSLRLADVDLEASARATAAPRAAKSPAAQPAAPVARPPVLVLRTADVGRASEPPAEEAEEAAADEAVEQAPAEAARLPVEVIAWRQAESTGVAGLEISGTLRNDSSSIVTGAGVHVSLFDHDGELIARHDAFLDAVSIAARATTGFRALFPGVQVFDGEPAFEVRARPLALSVVGEDRESDQESGQNGKISG